jgi:hypothetical protein
MPSKWKSDKHRLKQMGNCRRQEEIMFCFENISRNRSRFVM